MLIKSGVKRTITFLRRLHLPSRNTQAETFAQSKFSTFLAQEAIQINEARLQHLRSLALELSGKSVLEVGAGIGLLTEFFEQQQCKVLSTDARPENIEELRRRYPHRQALVLDLDRREDLSDLGTFDIVFCYGTLYHLSNAEGALRALSGICKEMILVETMVTPGSDEALWPVSEDNSYANQAYSGIGCRPTRPWVMNRLKVLLGYAYATATQPYHPDFTLDWVHSVAKKNHRAIFVGSKRTLDNRLLLDSLPDQQTFYFEQQQEIWLDVGAHLGQTTIGNAQNSPWITVYAFEPNLRLAAQQFNKLANFIVIPMAVTKYDGFADFYLNTADATSSLLPFKADGFQAWIGREYLILEGVVKVPTIRLDTFLNRMNIAAVDYLKIDAQGADFDVILSLGDRLRDVKKIKLEVAITARQLYDGAHGKREVVDYLIQRGFTLIDAEPQSYGQEENLTFTRTP